VERPRLCFHNRFVNIEELVEFIGAADVYITPYLGREQSVSGTLAYTVGAGKGRQSPLPTGTRRNCLPTGPWRARPVSRCARAISAAVIKLIEKPDRGPTRIRKRRLSLRP